jgi:type I restriction enzyme, S subunit
VLKAAVEGELTLEWRAQHQHELEPAAELLARILRERRAKWEADQLAKLQAQGKPPKDDKWKAKYKEAAATDGTELGKVPGAWATVSLGQLTWLVKDGVYFSPSYVSEGVPFITGGNVRPNGVDFTSAKRITPELHQELCKKCKPEKGDILYTKDGTIGIARVNAYDLDFNVWVHVAGLKLVDSVEPFFLQHALNSPVCYSQSQKFTHGVGNQDLGLTRMVNIALTLPSMKEQQQIIAEIKRRLSVADEIEATLNAELKRAERLRQAILKRAFEGKLAPQDPHDEPAAVLLERIKSERGVRAALGKKSGAKKTGSADVPSAFPLREEHINGKSA